MTQLSKKEILELMRYAGNFQRDVFKFYDSDISDVTKFKGSLDISVYYSTELVSFDELDSLFREHFASYRNFINNGGCYTSVSSGVYQVAHFELWFYA